MTFSLNGIKQERKEKYPIEMLMCIDDQLLARKFLEQQGILILDLKEFYQDKKTFGDVYFTSKFNLQEIEIVTKYEDIQEACNFFSFIWFEVKSINNYNVPISEKMMSDIITHAKDDTLERKLKIREQIQKELEQENKVYEDVALQSAKTIISRVFEKIDETMKRTVGTVASNDVKKTKTIKKLKSLTEELRKQNMWANLEKIKDTVKEIFIVIEPLNTERYTNNVTLNQSIGSDSLVTESDITQELERMENIQMLKFLHIDIPTKNQNYVIFGIWAVVLNLFKKDVIHKLSDFGWLAYKLYDIIEFILLVIVALLGIYGVINELYLFAPNKFGLGFSLISIGIWWMISAVLRQMRNKSISRLLLFIVIAIGLHYVCIQIIKTNFAL
jgi:hypothetical protein